MTRDRVREVLTASGLAAVLATTPENVAYATGLSDPLMFAFGTKNPFIMPPLALITMEGEVALLAPATAVEWLAQEKWFAEHVHLIGQRAPFGEANLRGAPGAEGKVPGLLDRARRHQSVEAALAAVVREFRLSGLTVGIDQEGATTERRRVFEESLGTRAIDASHVLRLMRMVKDERELDCLRVAVGAVERAMAAAFARVTVGTTEQEIAGWIRAEVGAQGLESGHCETSAGTRSGGRFPPSSYKLKDGDVIRSDCGGRWRGYWADTGRSAALCHEPARLGRYYRALCAGIDSLVDDICPGARVGRIARAAVDRVRREGIPDYRRRNVGHGIGLELYEAPLLVPDDEDDDTAGCANHATTLEPGMVINVELPYFELGVGGLQIEETVVVTQEGCKLLTTASRDMHVCGLRA